MSEEGRVPDRGRNSLYLHTSYDADERLLPGLPDDIVLDVIVPKSSWRAFHILSSVSRPWRRAIQSRQVYDARVRFQSTEKLVVMNCHKKNENGRPYCELSLYSVRDRSWHHLPPFPRSRRGQLGVPKYCECVSLDGKIYILGGKKEYDRWNNDDFRGSCEVYVLDLGGQKEWKQCASMPQPRWAFGSTILDGKVYVSGGVARVSPDENPNNECVVYDSKENAWSSIMRPAKYERAFHHSVTVGEKIFVHGGEVYDQLEDHMGRIVTTSLTEFYHPSRDEWGLLESSGYHKERLFTTQQKLYMITRLGIYGHDISDGNHSWSLKHSCSFSKGYRKVNDGDGEEASLEEFDPQNYSAFEVESIEAVDDELLVIISWGGRWSPVSVLHESKGFGTNKAEIVWEIVSDVILGNPESSYFMCPIQL